MPIANFSTTVAANKTVMEIQSMLVKYGAKQILTKYGDDGELSALSFVIDTPYGPMPFQLPANTAKVQRVLDQQGCPARYITYEHSVKVAWRILKDWVRAQLALLETEMVTMEQIFLPYMVVGEGKTLYDTMLESKFMLKEGSK